MPPRFFSPTPLPRTQTPFTVDLDASIAQHLQVLRLKVGDAIVLFDGQARQADTNEEGELLATIAALERRHATATAETWQITKRESPLVITLAQALAVGDKMDLIVQKATELGAACVVPVRSARTTLKLDAERAAKRLQHWHGVVIAACEQCGRNRVPHIADIADLDQALTQAAANGACAILHPNGGISLRDWTQAHQQQPMTIVVGPEGGFTDEEIALARSRGATLVTLGPRVLRTETAGLAALAVMQASAGDLG
jgi:16S rRNA (uracil1498-N3)-methyltransferase